MLSKINIEKSVFTKPGVLPLLDHCSDILLLPLPHRHAGHKPRLYHLKSHKKSWFSPRPTVFIVCFPAKKNVCFVFTTTEEKTGTMRHKLGLTCFTMCYFLPKSENKCIQVVSLPYPKNSHAHAQIQAPVEIIQVVSLPYPKNSHAQPTLTQTDAQTQMRRVRQ